MRIKNVTPALGKVLGYAEGMEALLSEISSYRDELAREFTASAQSAVFNPDARIKAAVASGKVHSINALLDALESYKDYRQ